MTWHHGPFLAFDTETTGVDVETTRIVTATAAFIDHDEVNVRTWLINPGVEIPQVASDVHGITTDHARQYGRPPADCLPEIGVLLDTTWQGGIPVLAFNAPFDLTLLDRELNRHRMGPLRPGIVLDPFVIDKHVDRYRKGKRTLTAVCEHYGVVHGGAHDATADALAAARVMWAIGQRYPHIAAMPLDELHAFQIAWAAEQAASFRQYLTRQGITDDLPDGAWPLRPYTTETNR